MTTTLLPGTVRRRWAKLITRGGLHLFTLSAYLSQEELERFEYPSSLTPSEQKRRRAFLARLSRERVVRRWMIVTDDALLTVEHPCGAPLFLMGEKWAAFEAELAAAAKD